MSSVSKTNPSRMTWRGFSESGLYPSTDGQLLMIVGGEADRKM